MEDIKLTIKEKVPEWKDVDPNQINLERMTGITN
jgi:hypothetical protein